MRTAAAARRAGVTTLRIDPMGDGVAARLDTLRRAIELVREECGAAA